MVTIRLNDSEMEQARGLAHARATEAERRRSPDRPTSANAPAQLRGAVGEAAAAKWAEGEGYAVERGFEADEDEPDLRISGVGFEVMTAQVRHREVTGFCVPPNKLWAHKQRGVRGYVFVGTGSEQAPQEVEIQALCRIEDVDVEPARPTSVRPGGKPVDNYVIPDDRLLAPDQLKDLLGSVT